MYIYMRIWGIGEGRGERGNKCFSHLHRAHDPGGDLNAVDGSINRLEQPLLVLLQVFVVGAGQPLEGGREANLSPKSHTCLAPKELEGIGVLLLRHERRAGSVSVTYEHLLL